MSMTWEMNLKNISTLSIKLCRLNSKVLVNIECDRIETCYYWFIPCKYSNSHKCRSYSFHYSICIWRYVVNVTQKTKACNIVSSNIPQNVMIAIPELENIKKYILNITYISVLISGSYFYSIPKWCGCGV